MPDSHTPLVTVIIPTRDRPELLQRAVASVLAQTCADFEVIVVDDGSGEASDPAEAARDPRRRVLRHAAPRGAAAARNTGLSAARGDFVAFLDDDDVWLPEKLARQLEAFATGEPDLGLVYCGSLKFSDVSGRVISQSPARPLREGVVDFLRSTRFGTSVPLIRRRCLDEVGGFDESLPGTQDRDLWIRLAQRFRFDCVSDVLVEQHVHGPQITADLPRKVEARTRLLEKYRDELEAHPEIMAQYLWRLGMLCCADGQYAPGRRHLLGAIRRQPGRPVLYRDFVQSLVTPERYRHRLLATVFAGADGVPFFY
jgi:glycosyltransferase involved in cell wall biosynthesis